MLIFLGAAVATYAQEQTFSNPSVDYTFIIPEERWKQVGTISSTTPSPTFIFVDRSDGLFEIRKLSVKADTLISDLIRDEESKLAFRQGYISGKQENFVGKYRGTVFNFEFVRNARPMSGRFYFMRTGDDTVYVLRFEGKKDILRSIQTQTDSIARTFEVKK